MNHVGTATLYSPDEQPKPRVILEFKTKEDRDNWMGFFKDGGGEDAVYEGFEQEGWEYPEITITEEN